MTSGNVLFGRIQQIIGTDHLTPRPRGSDDLSIPPTRNTPMVPRGNGLIWQAEVYRERRHAGPYGEQLLHSAYLCVTHILLSMPFA